VTTVVVEHTTGTKYVADRARPLAAIRPVARRRWNRRGSYPRRNDPGEPRTVRRRETLGTTERAPRRVHGDVPAIGALDTVLKVLLAAGVLSSPLYIVATDVVAARAMGQLQPHR
jgi:hypothetical protein